MSRLPLSRRTVMLGLFGDLEEKYRAFIRREKAMGASSHARIIYERLYADLSILDAKGAALLQFISILVTAYTLVISPSIGRPITGWFARSSDIALLAGAASAYLSGCAALTIIWVRWAGKASDPETRAEAIFRVRYWRTVIYRIAWWLALVALVLLGTYLVLANVLEPPSPHPAPYQAEL